MPSKIAEAQKLLANGAEKSNNCSILDNTTPDRCAASYSVTKIGSTWYNPLQLPTSVPGTLPLSNLPGTGLTDFGAASITLALVPAYSSVITPAAFVADAGSIPPQALSSAGELSAGTGVATAATPGTGTAGASSPSTTGGVDIVAMPSALLMVCAALAVGLGAV